MSAPPSAWRRGAREADRLHRTLRTRERAADGGGRIDVFDAIEKSGLALLFRPLDGLLGAFVREPEPGAVLDARRSLKAQRYAGAHELGHFLLAHDPCADDASILSPADPRTDRAGGAAGGDQREAEADAFAMEFLLPPWLFALHQ